MDQRVIVEPMYLSRGATTGDIFIPAEPSAALTELQRLGIRYIYRQFKRSRPGIIVNDPAGSGKKLQITLFLDAIKKSLSEPCLILCNENDLPSWKYHFEKWTEDTEDVISEIKNIFVEKKIFISPYELLPLVSRREWSIVVVDDSIVSKAIIKALGGIKAHYKIWMLVLDLHKNLETYQRIHDWLDPNKKFWLENIPDEKPNDLMSKINRNIMLDSYFEDVVLNRFYLKQPEADSLKPKTVVSRKNKDPTGTKVKRSKRKIVEDDESTKSNIKSSKIEEEDSQSIIEEKNINKEITADLVKSDDEIMEQDNNDINNIIPESNDSQNTLLPYEDNLDLDTEISNKYESENENIRTDENQNTTDSPNESMELDLSSETNIDKTEIEVSINVQNTDSSNESIKLVLSEEDSVIGDSVCNETKISDTQNNMDISSIDVKMKKLEAETKNQFKGSILDQLF